MCYSKLTLKGTSLVINERYKFSYLKVTGETKMTQNMDINFEQTLTIFRYYFFKAYGTFVVHIKLKRWMPLTRKFLDFSYKIIVLHKYMYVITIFSLLCFVWWLLLTGLSWFPTCLAVLLVLRLHLLQAPFLTLISVVDGFKLHCTRSCFYLLSRSSKK